MGFNVDSRNLVDEAIDRLNERMKSHVNSFCATEDEIYMAAMACEITRLRGVVGEVHSWAVCGSITTPEDMAQNLPRIVEITAPEQG